MMCMIILGFSCLCGRLLQHERVFFKQRMLFNLFYKDLVKYRAKRGMRCEMDIVENGDAMSVEHCREIVPISLSIRSVGEDEDV